MSTRQSVFIAFATFTISAIVSSQIVPRPQNVIQVFNVLDYGAKCDGSTNDHDAILATLNAACAQPGSIVYTPPSANGCIVGRDHSNAYSILLPCGDITLKGVRGESFWKHPTGLPSTSIALLELQQRDNVTIDGMGFDGNWGNAATTITEASSGQALSGTYTLDVVSTAGFPAAPVTINVQSATGSASGPTQNNVVSCAGPDTATAFVNCTGGAGVVMRDFAIGYVDGISGINQGTQADPQNYLVFSRGNNNLTIQNSIFREAYGDGIWMGQSVADHTAWTNNARIINNTFYMMARIGVTFGAAANNVLVEGNTITYAHQQCIDAEPGAFATRSVSIRGNVLTGWWDPTQELINVMHIEEGAGGDALWGSTDSAWRVEQNTLYGPALFVGVWNLAFNNNTVIVDMPGSTTTSPAVQFAPLTVEFGGGDMTIDGNYFYTRAPQDNTDGDGNTGAVSILNSGAGSDGSGGIIYENPVRARISNNSIDAQNNHDGILLSAPGGDISNTTGTASSVGLTTLVDSTASWTTNHWIGYVVAIGGAQAAIHTNTATTLTLELTNNSTTTAWQTPLGGYAPTPTSKSYTIFRNTGVIDAYDNHISLRNTSGFGPGKYGVYLTHESGGFPGGRVRIHDNMIRDADTDGIHVKSLSNLTFPLVDIFRNYGFDDQASPTMTNLIAFENTPNITTFTMSDNIAGEGVTNEVSGLSSGIFLLHDGAIADWAGFGSPASVVAAPIGSTYRQLNGTGANINWTKQSGTGTSGWVADALQSTSPTFAGLVVGSQIASASSPSASAGTLGTGSSNFAGNITSVGATTTTLTFGGGGFGTAAWCYASPNASGTVELIEVTPSATAPVFSCFTASTGIAANCVDFTYTCVGK